MRTNSAVRKVYDALLNGRTLTAKQIKQWFSVTNPYRVINHLRFDYGVYIKTCPDNIGLRNRYRMA